MRVVLQRVSKAGVTVEGEVISEIDSGILILLGIEQGDEISDVEWLVNKIIALRIFNDEEGKMNLSAMDVHADFIVVSQFTLHASTKKGNRPSFIRAAKPDEAIPLYETFVEKLSFAIGKKVGTGVFGADMKVILTNDGPVTIIIDSKAKE